MGDPDIAIRLREADGGYFMRQMFTEAAEEIERLRAELDRLGPLMLRAHAEIKQLRTERDEARRLLCTYLAEIFNQVRGDSFDPKEIAKRRKWDCFKEDE